MNMIISKSIMIQPELFSLSLIFFYSSVSSMKIASRIRPRTVRAEGQHRVVRAGETLNRDLLVEINRANIPGGGIVNANIQIAVILQTFFQISD